MAKRGPKSKPTALKRLAGNPGKRRLPRPDEEPEGVGDLWAPPGWFDDEQREQWHYAIDHAPLGLLTGTDRDALAVWCAAAVEWQRAAIAVRQLGQLVTTKTVRTPIVWKKGRDGKRTKTGGKIIGGGNIIQNPALAIMNKQALIMLKAGGELGFSPAARTSLARSTGREGLNGSLGAGTSTGKTIDGRPASGLAAYLARKPDDLPN